MTPKNIKAKNIKKSSTGVDAGIQGSPPMLDFVQEAAALDSNPSMKQAAEITLKIAQKVQSVKDHKANLQRLADDVVGFIARIWKSYQELPADEKQNWPPKNDIEELVLKLEPILAFVEDQVKRSRTDRVFSTFTDSGKIQEYRERVQRAIRLFEINHPRINDAPYQVKVEEEKERTPGAELRQLTEEKKSRMIEEEPHRLQAEGKIRATDEEARQPQRLSHISDEQTRERLQDSESDHHDKEGRGEIELLREEIRVMKEAAEEKEKERKREETEKMDRIAAKERENERRRQSEEMARAEAEERRKLERRKALEQVEKSDHHDKEGRGELELLREEIRVMKEAAEEKEKERKREEMEKMDRIAAQERENERRRQGEDVARAEAEERRKLERRKALEQVEKSDHHDKEGRGEIELLREEIRVMKEAAEEKEKERKREEMEKMDRIAAQNEHRRQGEDVARVETEEQRRRERIPIAEEEDESGEESSSEAVQEPARKTTDKNKKANNGPTMPSTGAFPGHPSPTPPMFLPSHHPVDVPPHLWYSPYVGPTSGSPPATNHVSGFNNARIAGGINIGNVTNGDSTRGVPLQEQAAVPRQKHASRLGKRAKSRKVAF